ncbi:hypothetical protein [Nocardia nova]|uniref:hypothetical protein n=1 Tax=Nocardia nova TaxID=37330 RepID=UPI0033C9D751
MRVLDRADGDLVVASPVRTPIDWQHRDDPDEFRAGWTVDPGEAIFRGHYPGFLIFPGVCLVESVHRVAVAHAAGHGVPMSLREIEHARFLRPVFPGHRIIVAGRTTVEDGDIRCVATIASAGGDDEPRPAARVRLRYGRCTR